MAGRNDIQNTPNKNTAGFTQNPQNINKKGRNPSIKNQLKELLHADGKFRIPKKDILSIEEEGSVIVKVPKEMQVALRLSQLATGGATSTTIRAIQMIMEQFDGKPKQSIGFEINEIKPIETIRLAPRKETT